MQSHRIVLIELFFTFDAEIQIEILTTYLIHVQLQTSPTLLMNQRSRVEEKRPASVLYSVMNVNVVMIKSDELLGYIRPM